jgi:hypothetical protein
VIKDTKNDSWAVIPSVRTALIRETHEHGRQKSEEPGRARQKPTGPLWRRKKICDNTERYGWTEIWTTARSMLGRCALCADKWKGRRKSDRVEHKTMNSWTCCRPELTGAEEPSYRWTEWQTKINKRWWQKSSKRSSSPSAAREQLKHNT